MVLVTLVARPAVVAPASWGVAGHAFPIIAVNSVAKVHYGSE